MVQFYIISVGARNSLLSRTQVQEVLVEIRKHAPFILFAPFFMDTWGDQRLDISLKTMEKTDFFTREIEAAQQQEQFRISIHSAKDLPDSIHPALEIIAITQGVDSGDSLVMRPGACLKTLPSKSIIGVSSERREAHLKRLRPDLVFRDIRGKIDMRLEQLHSGQLDGLVIAEAALIRLGLTHLTREKLGLTPAPWQGKLAVVGRKGDTLMQQLFSVMDTRRQDICIGSYI